VAHPKGRFKFDATSTRKLISGGDRNPAGESLIAVLVAALVAAKVLGH
jgi:hypothetical protein